MWDIPAMVTAATGILDKVIPDADAGRKAAHEIVMEQLRQVDGQLNAQAEINKIEAAHPSIFVAGARPFILWVCGASLAWQYLLAPIVTWIAMVAGYTGTFPVIPYEAMFNLTLGMLGMAGWRTLDKIKGVETTEVRRATLP